MLLLLSSVVAFGQDWTEAQVARALAPFDYVLLLDRGVSAQRWSHALKASDAFLPCSTFKLPHALIALDTGVITLRENRKRCNAQECHSSHGELDLAEAIRVSCVSYFRQTARAIGPERMAAGLAKLGYPATGTLEPLDGFWLTGGMRITAEQQLRWIRRFYTEALPVKAEHLEAVRAASLRTGAGDWAIQGKTGATGQELGWFVCQASREGSARWMVILLKGKGATGTEAERRLRALLSGEIR
ncbi:penicillin-binding transpeptidase domain-containing protein [Geothrix sp. PMB-07]|uniref:penicillin-binding transpeptidase domain-containing protein n=1 Tax=Geothrix sp. PMB-07 TaxID=3068640 RepID=UPI002740AD41|nr:penicillin-binding transpeptidase domain-containing protein [Geothrix sp. PMB-07]WLT33067.1 penicillin-binding transpeptidase domain-containing protein [Geothrix sp. PMB-07]